MCFSSLFKWSDIDEKKHIYIYIYVYTVIPFVKQALNKQYQLIKFFGDLVYVLEESCYSKYVEQKLKQKY